MNDYIWSGQICVLGLEFQHKIWAFFCFYFILKKKKKKLPAAFKYPYLLYPDTHSTSDFISTVTQELPSPLLTLKTEEADM